MKERPILFSAPMVRALIEGRKTQTRRIVKPQPTEEAAHFRTANGAYWEALDHKGARVNDDVWLACPYGVTGDRLWVRESLEWRRNDGQCTHGIQHPDEPPDLVYSADGAPVVGEWPEPTRRVIPSIHMPRSASRLTLEITDVRVQRVNDISEEDCIAEGFRGGNGSIPGYGFSATPQEHFRGVFFDINKRAPRGENPWVWAITFKAAK